MAVFTGNGSAVSPSLTFSSDTDTGIYRDGTNSLGIALNGANAAIFSDNTLRVNQTGSAVGMFHTRLTDTPAITWAYYATDARTGATEVAQFGIGLDNTYGTYIRSSNTAGTGRAISFDTTSTMTAAFGPDAMVDQSGNLLVGGTLPSTPNVQIQGSGNTLMTGRLTAPQIGVTDATNLGVSTTSGPNYAITSKNFTYADTVTYLDAVVVGTRGAFKITVTGDDASNGANGIHVSEAWVVCSNNYTTNAAPTVIINAPGTGLDVQWKSTGSSATADVVYRTLQVRPQAAAANFFSVTVEVFGRYSLNQASVTFA